MKLEMTVKDLIEELNKIKDKSMPIYYTDRTDWTYPMGYINVYKTYAEIKSYEARLYDEDDDE
jgi:hypothetical protein